jgi:hypothetical protein
VAACLILGYRHLAWSLCFIFLQILTFHLGLFYLLAGVIEKKGMLPSGQKTQDARLVMEATFLPESRILEILRRVFITYL